ncbi:MAG: TonB family protein [Candidatus Omnitrophota bacterium]
MLFRINFNRAFVISFLWHMLCFFMVTIIIMPSGSGRERLSGIFFLGSILDDSSFKKEFQIFDYTTQQKRENIFSLSENMAESREERAYSDDDYFLLVKPYKKSINDILAVEKKLPDEKDENIPSAKREGSSGVKGEAEGRLVLFKPPMLEMKGLSFGEIGKSYAISPHRIKLKVVIAADGNVMSAENLETSGYPELDLAAIRYVKKWKFAPLSPDRPQYDQGGMVLLELKPDMDSKGSFKENEAKR